MSGEIFRRVCRRIGSTSSLRRLQTSTDAGYRKELDAVQAGYLREPCIRVDENDKPLGVISKEDCHRNPILHRAFSIFIFNRQGKMLLQQRAATKITFPGMWTNACCSHPHYIPAEMTSAEDDWLGIRRAAARKLAHELGLQNIDVARMHVVGRFIYAAESSGGWWEHELDYAIVLPDFEDPLTPNPEEVADCRFVDRLELQQMLAEADETLNGRLTGPSFSPWFRLFVQFRWLDAWWSNLSDLDRQRDAGAIHRLNWLKSSS